MIVNLLRILAFSAFLYVAVNGSAPSSSELVSSNLLISLPIEIVQEDICPKVDVKSLLRLTLASHHVHLQTFSCYIRAVLDLIRTSYRPIPNLVNHVHLLSKLTGDLQQLVESLFQNLSPGEICRFLDQIRCQIPDEIRTRLLRAYPVLQRQYDAVVACIDPGYQYPIPPDLPADKSAALFNRLCALRIVRPADRLRKRFHEQALIDAFHQADQLHLLTNRDFLWEMITACGLRLNLITILYHLPIPDHIDDLLPLYRGYWPASRHDRVNWTFLRNLSKLQQPDSRTTLAAFWAIPGVRRFYAGLAQDALTDYHGYFSSYALHQLRALQFPYLGDFLTPDAIGRIYELGVSLWNVDLLDLVLIPSETSIHSFLTTQPPPQFDINAKTADGQSAVDSIQWFYIQNYGQLHGPLLERIVNEAAPSLWRRVATQLQSSSSANLDQIVTIDSLQLRDLIPDLREPKQTPLPSCPDLLQRLVERHQERTLTATTPGQEQAAYLIPQTFQYDRAFLERIVNEKDRRTGFTLLHEAIATASLPSLLKLMSLPSLDLTVRDEYGHSAFDYVAEWTPDRRQTWLQCAELLSRHLERIREAFAASADSIDALE